MNFVKALWTTRSRGSEGTSFWHLVMPIVAYVWMVSLLALGSIGSM